MKSDSSGEYKDKNSSMGISKFLNSESPFRTVGRLHLLFSPLTDTATAGLDSEMNNPTTAFTRVNETGWARLSCTQEEFTV